MTRLVPWVRPALATIAGCVVVVLGLGVAVHDADSGNWFDDAVQRAITASVPAELQRALVYLTDPPTTAGLIAAIALIAAVLGRWHVTALAAAAPLIALTITELVLKPLVHRTNTLLLTRGDSGEHLAYPSGHLTGLSSLLAVIGLLVLGSRLGHHAKAGWTVALVGVVVVAAIGVIGRHYHYALDAIGAVGVSVAVTLATGMFIDRIASGSRPRRLSVTSERHRQAS